MRHTQLPDPAQSLEPWMFHQLKNQFVVYRNEAVDGIVDDLLLAHA
jgi:hypothetical protein